MVVEVEDGAAVVVEEAAVVVKTVAADPHSRTRAQIIRTPTPTKTNPSSVDPSTPTYRLETGRGAGCTIAGGVRLIFVQNRRLVRGKTFSLPNLQNEGQTSSAKIVT